MQVEANACSASPLSEPDQERISRRMLMYLIAESLAAQHAPRILFNLYIDSALPFMPYYEVRSTCMRSTCMQLSALRLCVTARRA
jgi:hypothetical protein